MRMALIAALSVIAIAPALAQEGGPGGGGMARLKAADANGDGAITRAEMTAARAAMFQRLDTNNDGFITDAERQAAAAAMPDRGKGKRPEGASQRGGGERGMERLDTNNDGKISRAEFTSGPMPMFDRLDANKNGTIEASEIEAARAAMAQRKQVTP